jgi:nucleoside-diphosphate-sugar epimerase
MTIKTAVIFGATGAIGTALAQQLSKDHADWRIQAVTRKIQGTSRLEQLGLPNLAMVEGDPLAKQDVAKLAKDADIVISCIGLHKYEAKYWAKCWPTIVENLLEATVQQGRKRRLVFCDNLYAYGGGHKEPISTNTPTVEASLKGKPNVRSHIRQVFSAHMKSHPKSLAVVGGADFFGPHVTDTSFLGDTMTGKIVKGQAPLAIGSATVVHDFCYTVDFARALGIACVDDRALDQFWICPHAIHSKTLTEIANLIAEKAEMPQPKLSVLPKFMIYLLSPFMGFMYEIIEMLPIWLNDYKIDDSAFIETFDEQATPQDKALEEYVAFYKQLESK